MITWAPVDIDEVVRKEEEGNAAADEPSAKRVRQ
jgi:hypothetical protein